MIKRIDHIIILTPNPYQTSKEIEEAFGLVAPSIMEFGMFSSAMFTFGNVNIEVLKLGDKQSFKPYLYGVAFEANKQPWELLEDLKQANIEHTLPIKQSTQMVSWTNVMLKGLLDKEMPSSYGMQKNTTFNRYLAKFFEKLMGFDFVVKSLMKDVGESMVFFCSYDERIKAYQEYSQKVFSAFSGGRYGLKGVESIIIEKEKSNTSWERLGTPQDEDSVQSEFIESDKNRLHSIVLDAEKSHDNKEIMISDVKFIIK
ncbi:MAG: hypothetical protein FAF03_06935 [Epsilonproteobacteria bacterium]|nr:hypothetical protein [Campylobacterota bacterium]